MKDDEQAQARESRWALSASVGVHLLVLVVAIFGLPVKLFQAEQEQAVQVDLVPPPEQEQKAEPPPPPAESAQEPEQPKEPPPGTETPQQQIVQETVMNPVFQFGEEDGGPRQQLDGNSAEDGAETPTPVEQAIDSERASETEQEAEAERDAQQAEADQVADAERAQIAEQEAQEASAAEPPVLTTEQSDILAALVEDPPTPTAKPAPAAKPQQEPTLQRAEKLFSRSVTNNPVATTAMRNMPRDIRAGRLCVTELREQLLNAWPPYAPDLLPTERLRTGTILNANDAAFRQNGEWYGLTYRCEVDADAMKVVSFAFSVGDKLPPSEWMRRGLPVQ
ncbi:MAG: DUF930 domain-containing protein [Mesorhizobium sp.]|nr:DUF930 domain-containing protein [Mesorhizobium sp.]MBL8575765.1 DUF930 domain-containing protein [Mesorhizobium sp.]